MSSFHLFMRTDNDAFHDTEHPDADEEATCVQIGCILRHVADVLEAGQVAGFCADTNGNRVGSWSIELDSSLIEP